MRFYFISLFILPIFFSCFNSQEKNVESVKDNKLTIDSLFGTWVNQNLLLERFPEEGLGGNFFPVSGFTISNDLSNKKLIVLQYGEQTAKFYFDQIKIVGDSIVGIGEAKRTLIGNYDSQGKKIWNFLLIQSDIYSDSSKRNQAMFSRISDCKISCSIEQFALNEILKVFPIKVSYKNMMLELSSDRKPCSCNGELKGFRGYTHYQILDGIADKNGSQIIKIALYNETTKENEFFRIQLGNPNYLVKDN